jgi:tetratricopeptide (TPR) repeat protein
LQDWSVPVVWERAPLRLWPKKAGAEPLKIFLGEGGASKPGALDQALPPRPDAGFYGRDETLYALDRAFDTHSIVLLHAYAGSGKTSTAAEFARWYALTGGVEGPVLFTSFERHLPLARVLDKIGMIFGDALEASGIQWDAVTDIVQRRRIALQVMQQVPVLWIWDNVEPVTGFPAGTISEWSVEEQQELRAFLVAARETQAKFLLTSRRDETAWLGDLPHRVDVPAMPMQERLQLAGAIVARRGKRLAGLPDLTPLLRFTSGNPLTIFVTVGAALRTGINTKAQLEAFVAALRSGEVAFSDEETEGRSKSLGASLSYGFGEAFNEDERKILAVLYLFRGFVNIAALLVMGDSRASWCLDAMCGMTRKSGVALLDRAAEIGLLEARGDGYYGIHPALPWYFRAQFERYFPEGADAADRARRGFAGAMGEIGCFYHNKYSEGLREVLSLIAEEEDNLLAAWRFARTDGSWDFVIGTMQGLCILYQGTGRRALWRRIVEQAIPDFVDPTTEGPLAGREGYWSIFTDHRVRLACEDLDWHKAAHLQRTCVDWDRKVAKSALMISPKEQSFAQRNAVRTLGVSLERLASIERAQHSPVCAQTLREALDLADKMGDVGGQASCAFNLGHAYMAVADLCDLDEAERWYRRSFDLRANDGFGRGLCLGQLGMVATRRFRAARAADRSVGKVTPYLEDATRLYEAALELFPESAITERGTVHNELGNIYSEARNYDRALFHYQQDIRLCESANDKFGAGQTRSNVAHLLFEVGRLPDARAYAEAARANFESFGDNASRHLKVVEDLIAQIDSA